MQNLQNQTHQVYQVILDTNFVLIPFSIGVQIFEEIEKVCQHKMEFVIFQGVYTELDTLVSQGGAVAKAAKAARSLLEQKAKTAQLNVLPIEGHVDNAIVAYVQNHTNCIVATQDKALKKRLEELSVACCILRQKKYIQIR
jgi:rRNA-processing protein FCF1